MLIHSSHVHPSIIVCPSPAFPSPWSFPLGGSGARRGYGGGLSGGGIGHGRECQDATEEMSPGWERKS